MPRQSTVSYMLTYGVLLAVALVPLWLVTMPPLEDYPNHLARMHILIHAPHDEVLGQFYQVHWALIPNLAMDLLVPPLAHLIPLALAGKVFISLTLVLLSSGTLALHYVLYRKLSIWPLSVFLLLYNGIFLYGILNFLFGLGVALWGLAAWIYLPARRAWPRALLFYAMSCVLFVSHLSALGVFAICVLGYEVQLAQRDKVRPGRTVAWASALALGPALPVLFFLLGSADTAAGQPLFGYDDLRFIVSRKLGALLSLFGNYAQVLDAATLGMAVWSTCYAGMAKRLSLDGRISGSISVLVLMFLVMPFQVFGSNFADSRILVAVAFLFVASFNLRLGFRYERAFAIGVLAIFGIRMAVITTQWQKSDKAIAQYVQAIDQLPEGSRLLALAAGAPGQTSEPQLAHVASLAVIRKSVFLPSMYAMPRGQPITFTAGYRSLARRAPRLDQWYGAGPHWDEVLGEYDYVLLIREGLFLPHPPALLRLVYEGTDFRLYRTPRASRAAAVANRPG